MPASAPTIGSLIAEARTILNDVTADDGSNRYSDADLCSYLNDALMQILAKRPDAYLGVLATMSTAITLYAMPGDSSTTFPLDYRFYPPVLFYVVGSAELREDTFTNDARATVLANKFVSQLLQVAS